MNKRKADVPPPFVAKETEKWVLGASILWKGHARQFLEAGIREPHFWSRHHAIVWRRIMQALEAGIDPPDLTQVHALLAKYNEIEDVGVAYLATLGDGVPRFSDEGILASARTLNENLIGRRALAALQDAQKQLVERPAVLTEGFFTTLGASCASLSAQLRGRQLPDHVQHLSDVMRDVVDALQAGAPSFVDTPWPSLTSILGGGFAPGELTFLGARPGLGKTAGALEIVRRAGKRGVASFVVSREMLNVAIGMRLIAQEGPVDAKFLRRRSLEPAQWHTVNEAVEQLQGLPVFLTHQNIDVDEIRRIVGLLVDEGPLGLVVVDYLQLIDAPAGIRERRLQVEAVSKGLKALTLDYQVPVLCLSSLSRPPDGKAPTLASLRESGNLEHDADTVILLHRPEELEPLTHCIVAKSRNGRTGLVKLHFRGEYLRFEEQYTGVAS